VCIVTEPQCVADVIDSVRTVGSETGTSEEAEVVAQSLEAGFQSIRAAVAGLPRPKVAFLEWTGVLELYYNTVQIVFVCNIGVLFGVLAVEHCQSALPVVLCAHRYRPVHACSSCRQRYPALMHCGNHWLALQSTTVSQYI
jgi:hypothetical protein